MSGSWDYADTWEVTLLSGHTYRVVEHVRHGGHDFRDSLGAGIWFAPNGNEYVNPATIARIKRVRRIDRQGNQVPVEMLA